MTKSRGAIIAAVFAVTCGLPLYFALDHLRWLPLALRDRPWPMAIMVAGGCVGTLVVVWRSLRARNCRVLSIGCAAISLASAIALVAVVGARYELPPSATGLEIGKPLDFTLPDHTGHPLQLASLRGRPVLIYFYRGSS